MRSTLSERLEAGRIRTGAWASDLSYGPTGAFDVSGPCGLRLHIVANVANLFSDGWEHVSVSTIRRTPNWREMCFVKELFWDDDEVVVQFHPAKSDYVNNHPHCLHLWRHVDGFPTPPPMLVGNKALGTLKP
jgi:hypothetical protein